MMPSGFRSRSEHLETAVVRMEKTSMMIPLLCTLFRSAHLVVP
jgi:hypothetical protein